MTTDIVCIAFVIAVFALTWGLVKACDLLSGHKPGDNP
jgi:hypothetical protein